MAYSQVQTATAAQTTANSRAVTVSSTGQNNLVVGGIYIIGPTETCTSVTDDKGNTYVVTTAQDTAYARRYAFYGKQVVGGATTITANFSGTSATKRVFVDEFSGFNYGTNAQTFDASAVGNGTGTSLSTSTLTPEATGELIWALLAIDNAYTFTEGSGYTLYGYYDSTSSGFRSQYKLSGSASETAPATASGSEAWTEIAIAFKNPPASTAGFFAIL